MNKLFSLIDGLSEWTGKIFAWLSLPMIGVLVFEIAASSMNNPTEWAHESTTMLYGTFCMVGAVWTLREKGHVRTEVLHQLFPVKLQILSDIFTGTLVLCMFGILFWGSFDFAMHAWSSGETSAKSTWGVPTAPFKTVIPFAVGLMFLQQLTHILEDIMRLCGARVNDRTQQELIDSISSES